MKQSPHAVVVIDAVAFSILLRIVRGETGKAWSSLPRSVAPFSILLRIVRGETARRGHRYHAAWHFQYPLTDRAG